MALREGDQVGNYRILHKLGEGGMGEVYEALQPQIRRRAAVKVLRAEYSDNKDIVGRFFNEALAVNVIQHPNLVAVLEAGFLPNGSAYLIMEYLQGETLYARLQRLGALKETPALLLARQISSALAAVHAQDIIHRDLKAENIMVIVDSQVIGGLRAKVLDFGLAKISARHQGHAVMTKDGVAMGTKPYMAPEQWMSASSVDAKADVYALGVTLFAMLAGRYPFLGETASSYMNQHLYEEPPSLKSICRQTTQEVDALVANMLGKKRRGRPTMREVANCVEEILVKRGAIITLAPEVSTSSDSEGLAGSQTDVDPVHSILSLDEKDLEIE